MFSKMNSYNILFILFAVAIITQALPNGRTEASGGNENIRDPQSISTRQSGRQTRRRNLAENFRMHNNIRDEGSLNPNIVHRGKTFVTLLAAHVQRYMLGIYCKYARRLDYTTRGRCMGVKRTSFEKMRIYIAPPKLNTVYSVVLPDDKLSGFENHVAVAVVDPFPRASFGHLVLVFYVDGATKPWCLERSGLVLGNSLCLTMAKRKFCHNQSWPRLSPDEIAKKCEVNFIPLVHESLNEESSAARTQQLECIPDVSGFGGCPKQVVTQSTVVENCELVENTKRCHQRTTPQPPSGSGRRRPTPCRSLKRCDHAVTLFGGWNEGTLFTLHEEKLRDFYSMLKRNGFRKNNIQIFYNGNGDVDVGEPYHYGRAASDKHLIRDQIQTLCQTELCVNSFVVYLNGPTTSDGSILLWDINGNGEAEAGEMYTVDEFLDDISFCEADHVFVFADQSYSGALTSSLLARTGDGVSPWSDVVVITSGDRFEYSWGRDVIEHWRKMTAMHNVSWAFEALTDLHSSPTIINNGLAQKFTLYGAPVVQGLPEYAETPSELKRTYQGCQDLVHLGSFMEWTLKFSSPRTRKNSN